MCVAFVTICEQFVITVVSALTLNISQPETSKHLIDQEVSREFTRVWTHLKSAAAQTPRPQRGSAGLSGLEKVELAAITTCSDCLANLLEIKEEQQRVAGPLIRLILLSLWLFVILNYLDVKPAPSSTRLTANIKTVLIRLYCYAADAVQLKWNEMRGRDEVSFTDGEGGSHFYCK